MENSTHDQYPLIARVLSERLVRRSLLKRVITLSLGSSALGGLLSACEGGGAESPTAGGTAVTPEVTAPPTLTAVSTATPSTAPAETPGATPQRGGKVTWALSSDPTNLLPFGAVPTSNMWGKEFMYDSLLEWDRNLNIQPALAETYDVSSDAMEYTFILRQGVKFHNGKELEAADVKYSLEMAVNPPPPGVKLSYLESLTTATFEAVDARTFKIRLKSPDPTLPGIFAWQRYTPIVPEGILDKINPLSEGIGTGPFKLVTFVANDRVEYERNPDFWKPGLPYLDRLTLKVLPDENARLAALRSGEIDGGTFSADIARRFEKDPSVTVLKGLVAAPRVLQFVIHGGEPWADVRVRQAINAAIDRQEIIDKVYSGDAVLTGPIPPGYGDWFIPPEELASTYYKYDVDRARELMNQAGFSNGFRVTLQSIAEPRDYTQIAEIIKEQLKAINIDVMVQPLEIGTFAKNNGEGAFEWQLTSRGMRGDPSGFVVDFRPPAALFEKWFKGGWENQELTEAYDQALKTFDREERKRLYRRIQEIILAECPNIYLVQNMKYHLTSRRLKNMYVSYTDFHTGLREAWIEE